MKHVIGPLLPNHPAFAARRSRLIHLLHALHHITEPDAVDRVGLDRLDRHVVFFATLLAQQDEYTLDTIPFWPVEEPFTLRVVT